MIEIWKDIEGYEGLYQISNLGRIKSLERVVQYKNSTSRNSSGCHTVPEKIKKQTIKGRGKQKGGGYSVTVLYNDGEQNMCYIHRLVAQAFIPNPKNKETVNHIDGNKQNNNVSNLEWATYTENNSHAINTRLATYENRKNEQSKSIPVNQYDKDHNLIATYPSMREAERQTGCDATQIGKCCKNPSKTCGGFYWGLK